jgi:AbiV family abortive infection protein
MKERVLNAYWGRLSPDKIAEGMNVARINAVRLASDARTMFEMRRYETAGALAILSIEESGKISILRELAIATDASEVKQGWKRLRSHTAKNTMWIFPELVAAGARRLDEFSAVFDPTSDHTGVLDKLKQVCLYSDCYGEARWHQPAGAMPQDLASHLVKTAEVFAAGRDVMPREIELWIQHMRPVRHRSHGW